MKETGNISMIHMPQIVSCKWHWWEILPAINYWFHQSQWYKEHDMLSLNI